MTTRTKLSPIPLSILCLGLTTLTANATESIVEDGKTRLLPDVANIVFNIETPSPQYLKQNVYSGLLAIDAPEGMDPLDIGTQVITNNFSQLKQAISTHTNIDDKKYDNPEKHYGDKKRLVGNFKINDTNYQYTCAKLNATDCIGTTLANKENIQALMTQGNNAKLMQRYMEIRALPHDTAYMLTAYDYVPMYGYQVQLSNIRLAQTLFAFNEGNANTAFNLLGEEMAAAKRILREDENLIGHMVAINMLYTGYHTISELIDNPAMQPYLQDPRLLTLLTPLNEQEQKALAKPFENERNFGLRELYMFNGDTTSNENELIKLINKTIFAANYDRYATVNIAYKSWQPTIERASTPMNEVAKLYAQGKLEDLAEADKKAIKTQATLEEEARKANPNIPPNVIGYNLIDSASFNTENYLQRLYDLQGYILLVNAKHQIVSKGLKSDEIDVYLKQAGATAQNPITREPFTWDAHTGTLSTPWLAQTLPAGGKNKDESMPRNAVYIKRQN